MNTFSMHDDTHMEQQQTNLSAAVTCHPAEVRIPSLPQPKQVIYLASPERCIAELTYVTWKRTGWEMNQRPTNRKSNALPQRQHAIQMAELGSYKKWSLEWRHWQCRPQSVWQTVKQNAVPLCLKVLITAPDNLAPRTSDAWFNSSLRIRQPCTR